MASPADNPIYNKLVDEYKGKILYDGGYYRVFSIQFVPNKGMNRYLNLYTNKMTENGSSTNVTWYSWRMGPES